ncbi:MAG TPA: hypothetical protein VF288_10985, partial [Mycobacteriales bacterium]
VGANGTFTLPVTVGSRLDISAVAPGQIDVWADGHHLETDAFWNYHDHTALIDLIAGRLRDRNAIPSNGDPVTVTITASRFAGPYWLVSAATAKAP